MKTFILSSLLLISGCALMQDFQEADINWSGSGKPREVIKKEEAPGIVTVKKEDGSEVTTPDVPYEETISKNWDYSKHKDLISGLTTYEARTISQDKTVTFSIVKNDKKETAMVLSLNTEDVSYRDGHSIEMFLDNEKLIQMVKPSNGKSSKEVVLSDGANVSQLLANKKQLIFELIINGKGNKKYHFDISGLQPFFTTI